MSDTSQPPDQPPPERTTVYDRDAAARQRADEEQRQHRRRRWLKWVGIAVSIVIVAGIATAIPMLRTARERARRVNCAGNLKCAGLSLLMYSGDYGGYFPVYDNLQVMVDEKYLQEGKVWSCPSQGFVTTSPATTTYIYIGSGIKDDDPAAAITPIWHEAETNHPGGWINVLFVDGHAEGHPATSWIELRDRMDWKTLTDR